VTPDRGPVGSAVTTHRAVGVTLVILMVSALVATGCGVVNAAKKAVHDVEANKATIDAFTTKVKAGESTTFEATYVTTGSAPATIVYAVHPPQGLAFTETPSTAAAGGGVDIIVNASGEFSCSPPAVGSGTGAAWSCQKVDTATASTENQIFAFYTPAHWINFLKGFSLAAGLAGDRVTSSNRTVNGFAMQCVDFRASGVPGTSTICTTAQGILGYVKVAADATSFEIKSYSSTPPSSLFEPPPGATITTLPTSTTAQ
jgi:hypothetical protein